VVENAETDTAALLLLLLLRATASRWLEKLARAESASDAHFHLAGCWVTAAAYEA
jgi:hypothetical protein